MRLSLLSLSASLCLAGAVTAQDGGMSEEMRQEIRRIVREEIRAALKEAHAAAPAESKLGGSWSSPGKAVETRVWSMKDGKLQSGDAPAGAKRAKAKKTKKAVKAFRLEDGELVEIKLDAPRLELDGAKGLLEIELPTLRLDADGKPHATKPAARVLTLSHEGHAGKGHDFQFVVGDDLANTAIVEVRKALQSVEECCEAVKAAKAECCEGEKAEACEGGSCEGAKSECCEQRETEVGGQVEAIEIQVQPVEVAPEKAKAKGGKAKKAKTVEVETADDVIQTKIRKALEKSHH